MIVLFRSGYSNAYFKPLPEGRRLTFEPAVERSKPGWPAPTPEVMDYLHGKGVWHLGTDGPSMGYTDGGLPTHAAGLKYGMSWTELLINLDQLPVPRSLLRLAAAQDRGSKRQPRPRHRLRAYRRVGGTAGRDFSRPRHVGGGTRRGVKRRNYRAGVIIGAVAACRVRQLEITICDFKLGWPSSGNPLCFHPRGCGHAFQCPQE